MDRLQKDIEGILSDSALFAPFRDSSVLVTGATGLLGSMLIRTFLAANEKYSLNMEIIGQIRNPEKAASVFGDLCSKFSLVKKPEKPSRYIIHTVSPTTSRFFIEHPVETIQVSVGSTMEILEHARECGASVVYLSSMEQYGVPYVPGSIMTEEEVGRIDHLSVRSSYPESKRLCECLCASYAKEYGTDVKIARLAQTFGAGAPLIDNRMPMQFARAAAEGRDIILHTEGKSVSNFVYLSDAISGILTILLKGTAGEAYNICNDKETRTVKEIALLTAENAGGGRIGVRVEIPAGDQGYAPDVNMFLDSSKLRTLGWKPQVGMAEAYRRLTEYLRENAPA